MKKNKKLFAILTLVAFMMTLVPALAFAEEPATPAVTVAQTGTIDKDGVHLLATAENFTEAVYSWKLGNTALDVTTAAYAAVKAGTYTVTAT